MASKLLAKLRRKEKEKPFCLSGVKTVMSPPYGCRDADVSSASSGYHSAYIDTSGDNKRLQASQNKTPRVCERIESGLQTPTCSSPKQSSNVNKSSEDVRHRRRPSQSSCLSGGSKTTPMLIIKRNLGEKSRRRRLSTPDSAIDCDDSSRVACEESKSCLQTPVSSCSSEVFHTPDLLDSEKKTKRKPFCELSISGRLSDAFPRQRARSAIRRASEDTPVGGKRTARGGESRGQSRSARRLLLETPLRGGACTNDVSDSLPRQRSASVHLTPSRWRSSGCLKEETMSRDDSVEWDDETELSLDESMNDFLSAVRKENLKDFLNFYDKITSTSSRRACSPTGRELVRNDRRLYERYV